MITRVIYSSKASPDLSITDIERILETARKKNTAHEITGIMILAGNSFIQLLEGNGATIETLLEKIRSDGRHTDMEVLTKDQSDHRIFSQWAMAYSAIDNIGMKKIGGTFNMRVARQFLSYMDGEECYLQPVFKEIFDQFA